MIKEIEDIPHIVNSKTCFFGNYPPKPCGIATFTCNLSTAMDQRFNPKLKSKVIAINDMNSYNYDADKVVSSIHKEDIEHYINIAKNINENEDIKLVCVQHEFGIFGGHYGSYIVPFLETLKKPCVITFHSVLPNPDDMRLRIVRAICNRSAAIVVMANIAIEILHNDYGIEKEKIHVVHHGIPNVPFVPDNEPYKEKLGLKDRKVLATFGLLSRGKGIEFVVKSLPELVKKYPNLTYMIVGETHPVIVREEGEKYRNALMRLITKLGLDNHVKWVNKYMNYDDLIEHILACDIYVCSNLERNQITSGTLIEAMGYGGKAIVSTKSIYAEEVLADGRGVTVDFRNPEAFTEGIDKVLSNPDMKKEMERLAYAFSRQAVWSNVALSYLKIFNNVVELRKEITEKFPPIKLSHVKRLTDDFGMIQFANHSTPELSSGYTIDDNARALIVTTLHNNLFDEQESDKLSKIYLDFIEKSQNEHGNFKNNFKNSEEALNPYSEDSFGRTVWALGYAINHTKNTLHKEKSKKLLEKSLNYLGNIDSPRAKAFTLTGLYHYYKEYPNEEILSEIRKIANKLVGLYERESSDKWQWFEPYLTYSNSTLTEALYLAYELTGNKNYLNIAEKTLKFLTDIMFIDGKFHPIGQNGWYNRNKERAFFDQQPLDSSALIQTYLVAYNITKNEEYYTNAVLAFNWFLGHNHLNQMIYDETTGGCFDGLGRHSLNFNQGAESTVSYLLARLFMEEIQKSKKSDDAPSSEVTSIVI